MTKSGSKSTTTPADVSRVQASVAKTNGGTVPKGSYVSRMARTAAKTYGKSGGK